MRTEVCSARFLSCSHLQINEILSVKEGSWVSASLTTEEDAHLLLSPAPSLQPQAPVCGGGQAQSAGSFLLPAPRLFLAPEHGVEVSQAGLCDLYWCSLPLPAPYEKKKKYIWITDEQDHCSGQPQDQQTKKTCDNDGRGWQGSRLLPWILSPPTRNE